MKTTTLDIIKIVSEFTFLFWLDNFEHINEKRIQFGETFPEEINHLCDELQNIWNSEHYSAYFESTLKVCSDSINFIEGLRSHVKITDQGQAGSSSFNLSRSLTSTSTPKDIQTNNNLQSKQKSTIKPDKLLTSNSFGNQQNIVDDIDISDSANNYMELKDEITATVTNHTNKLIDNLEMKYQQMNTNGKTTRRSPRNRIR